MNLTEVKLYVNVFVRNVFKLNCKDIEFGYFWHSGAVIRPTKESGCFFNSNDVMASFTSV